MKTQATAPLEQKQLNYESNPFKVVFRGFNRIFEVNKGWAIAILVLGLFSNFSQVFNSSEESSPTLSQGEVVAILIAALAIIIVVTVLSILYRGMLAYVTVKTIEGKAVGFKEALLAAAERFWTLLGLQIIVSLKILGGFLLLIVPGVRAALRYNMVFLPVFDKNAEAFEAMNDMKQLTKDHLIEVFGMTTAAAIVPIIGSVLGVGGQIVMYPQLRSLKASGVPKPPVHWLNYLGFVLFVAIILFAALIIALIVAISHK